MSDIVSRDDIESTVNIAFPPHLDVLRKFFYEYADGILNHSDITELLTEASSTYSPFETMGLSPELLVYDPRLKAFSDLDIRHLVAMSLGGEGVAFFTSFFDHFFNRFELHYADSQENLYETVSQIIRSDEGSFTDEGEFTDAISGLCTLHAQVIFDITEVAAAQLVWDRTVRLLSLMKPARLFVFHVPVVDIRLNALIAGDPQYDATLLTGDSPSFGSFVYNTPDKLQTDADPVWKTDGAPPIKTDGNSTEGFLQSLSILVVRYASAPAVDVALTATVTLTRNASNEWCYRAQAELPEDIVYLSVDGSITLASMDVLKPVYIKPFNTDEHMRLRVSWVIPEGYSV